MTDKITLTLNAGEAMFALDAITKAATEAHRVRRFLIATNAGTDERAIVDLSAEVLDRLELRIRNLMFPACDWMHECEMAPAGKWTNGNDYCQFHLDKLAGKSPVFAA